MSVAASRSIRTATMARPTVEDRSSRNSSPVSTSARTMAMTRSTGTTTSKASFGSPPNQARALAGMRRALKPGGHVAAIVYSTPDRNAFFSIPVSIIRRRAQLPPPLPGQPGPFSLGGEGVLAAAFERPGFGHVKVRAVPSPLRLPSAAECVRFERESFGALHQMMAGLGERERAGTWAEIEVELAAFETADGFVGPCEMLVGVATKEA